MVTRPKYNSIEVLKISLKRKKRREGRKGQKRGREDQQKAKVANWNNML